jgi:hypothetical protein
LRSVRSAGRVAADAVRESAGLTGADMTSDVGTTRFLNECERPDRRHFTILGMSWAGWLFDFYDLMMFSFLLVPIR